MDFIENTLISCHAATWRFRETFKEEMVEPSVRDSLLFAFTEMGESVDAFQRTKPEFFRTNAKDLEVLAELTDYAFNLLTALGRDAKLPVRWRDDAETDLPMCTEWHCYIDDISRIITLHHSSMLGYNFDWRRKVWLSLERVARYPGMNLRFCLSLRLIERAKIIAMSQSIKSSEIEIAANPAGEKEN